MALRGAVGLAPSPFAPRRLGFRQRVGGDTPLALSHTHSASPRRQRVPPPTRAGAGDGRHSRSKLREKETRKADRENESSRYGDGQSSSENKLVKVDDGSVTVNFKNAGAEVKSLGSKIKKAHRKAMKKVTKKVDAAISGFSNGGTKPVSFKTGTGVAKTYNRSNVGYAAPPPWVGGLVGWGVLFAAAWAVTKVFGLGGGGGGSSGGGFSLPSFGIGKRKRPKGAGPGRWVTDRSLGGREVFVEDIYSGRGARGNPLADTLQYADNSRSEKMANQAADEEKQKARQEKLVTEAVPPSWWRYPQPGYCPENQKADLLQNARRVLAKLSSKRIAGTSYSEYDLADLRDACALAGASVADRVKPKSATTGLFKAGVSFAVDAAARRSQTGVIGDPQTFLSGLAGDVGVTPGKAGRLVQAAVAAKLRADLLQAAAQKRSGDEGDAMLTLDGAIGVLQTFPFGEDAPELEMIAGGLKSRINDGERRWLANTFKDIGGGETCGTVNEALGL